ncbi:MAG TPA: MarR family transcriptional regulator [Gammaproteobacteria bacterium]|nr:MarR family transcriptional regulator [Gammaproteobacteria bacterium]
MPESERLAQDMLNLLRRITRSMDIASRQLIGKRGLSLPQLLCLQHLREHGPQRSGALARQLELSPPTVTGILDRLELRGLINRERRPEDKRHVFITLTASGCTLANATPSTLTRRLARALGALPAAERSTLHTALQQLDAMLQSADKKTSGNKNGTGPDVP